MNELAAGSVGGTMLCVAGHPLDTIKVKQQNKPETYGKKSVFSCLRSVYKKHAIRGFFAGLSAPLMLGSILNASLFLTFGASKKAVSLVSRGTTEESGNLSLKEVCFASLLAAPVYSIFVCPVDAIKVNMQTSKAAASGPIACARSLGIRNIYASYYPTVGTRLIGSPAYFCSYELARSKLESWGYGNNKSFLGLVSGFFAGIAFWSTMYPIDLIKSRMSVKSITGHAGSFSDMVSGARSIWVHEGVAGFYKGFVPCILRAGPANSIMFFGYEATIDFLERQPSN